MRTKFGKPKARTYAAVKKSIDIWFAKFIKNRDCKDGWFTCISCGQRKIESQFNAGHFISRSKLSVRWNEKNVSGQCVHCNCYLHGNQYEYSKGLDKRYGAGTAEFLSVAASESIKASRFELEILEKHYKEKCK